MRTRLGRTARLAAAALTVGVLAAAAGCSGSGGAGNGTSSGPAPALGTTLPHFSSMSMTGSHAFLGTLEGVIAVGGV